MDVLKLIGAAIGLVPLTMFLVSSARKLGLEGRALTITSFIIGLALGVSVQIATAMPETFAAWLFAVVFGLVVGGGACGAYDLAQDLLKPKAPDLSGTVLMVPQPNEGPAVATRIN